jgi:glutamate-1-semialdehyde 2,1-aminomutase
VWDADGREYRDFIGEYTAGVYGHSASEIHEAVNTALAAGINLGGNNLAEGELARLLCERFASVERVRFTNSGSEANLSRCLKRWDSHRN